MPTRQKKQKANPLNPQAAVIQIDYNGLPPDADSCLLKGVFMECYDFRDSGQAKALEFHGQGRTQIVWRSRCPFIILFQTSQWWKYLRPLPPTLKYLFLPNKRWAGLHSFRLGIPGKFAHLVAVAVKPKKGVEIEYRFIPDLCGPAAANRRRSTRHTTSGTGSAGTRATINLQD